MGREGSITDRVRQYAAAGNIIRKAQAADALGLTPEQVKSAVQTLVEQGWLRRIEHGIYRFEPRTASAHEAPLEDRIWRAMRINPKWACSDIAIQAGTTVSYVYKRMRDYVAEHLVAPAGRRPVAGASEKLWRLTGKGKQHLDRPPVEPFEPDPLVVAAVKLNRLVCTGMAARPGDAQVEAIRLCRELEKKLSGVGDVNAGESGLLQAT